MRCLSALLSLLAAESAYGGGSEDLAAKLLGISNINVVYVRGIVAGYKESAAKKSLPSAEVRCFTSKVTEALTLQPLAKGYATEFDDGELQFAIAFFESEAGRKYAQYQLAGTSRMFGLVPQDKEPEITTADYERISAFLATRIGKLILGTNTPMARVASSLLRPQLLAIRDDCHTRR